MSETDEKGRKQEARMMLKSQLRGHKDRVWSVAWSQTGKYIASTSGDKTIRIWSQADPRSPDWSCVALLDGVHSRTVRSVAWSPDGKYLASCGFDGLICIWSYSHNDGWECTLQLEGHENEVKSVAWSVSGHLLASCSRDKSIWIWDASETGGFECVSVLHGHSQDIKKIIWHPEEDWLVSCSYDDTMRVWTEEEDDWYSTQTVTSHTSTVWDACFNQSGTQLASVSDDCSVQLFSVSYLPVTNKPNLIHCMTLPYLHTRAIFTISWAFGNSMFATGGADDAINLCLVIAPEAKDGKMASSSALIKHMSSQLNAHDSDVNCVAFHPKDSSVLASVGDDMVIKIWHVSLSSSSIYT